MRRSAALSLSSLIAIASCSGGGGGGSDGGAIVPPADLGPPARSFAVGQTTRSFVDLTRPTPANGAAPSRSERDLPTEIWYPAPGDASSGGGRDAAPARDGAPYPLVVFVHGSSGNRRQSTFLTEALASAGYLVAAADHPLTASSTPGGPSDAHVGDELDDTIFLADRIAAISADASDALHGLADPKKGIAIAGHSTGGTIALLAAYAPDRHDPRVRAVIALAPCACFFGEALFQTRSLPLLVVAGSDDLFVPPATNGARAYDLAPAPRYLATLVGGNHLFFTDYPIPDAALAQTPTSADDDIALALAAYGGGTACRPLPAPGADPALTIDAQHDHTIALARAFLDDELRGEPQRLAALVAAADPEVRMKHE